MYALQLFPSMNKSLTGLGHERHMKGQSYGLARSRLPRNVAVPLNTVAEM